MAVPLSATLGEVGKVPTAPFKTAPLGSTQCWIFPAVALARQSCRGQRPPISPQCHLRTPGAGKSAVTPVCSSVPCGRY